MVAKKSCIQNTKFLTSEKFNTFGFLQSRRKNLSLHFFAQGQQRSLKVYLMLIQKTKEVNRCQKLTFGDTIKRTYNLSLFIGCFLFYWHSEGDVRILWHYFQSRWQWGMVPNFLWCWPEKVTIIQLSDFHGYQSLGIKQAWKIQDDRS